MCIARATTLAPFLVRFMTQSDTMAHGTDHKTWETTLSPSGSGTVLARNHHAGFSTLFSSFPFYHRRERKREIGPENRINNNYYAPPNSRVELIISRFNRANNNLWLRHRTMHNVQRYYIMCFPFLLSNLHYNRSIIVDYERSTQPRVALVSGFWHDAI